MQRERPYMIAAGWAVAAHRILLDPAPKVKILSAGRCFAASDSVGALSTARGLACTRPLAVSMRRHVCGPCIQTLSGLVRSRARAVERAPAQTPLGRREILV